MWDRYDGIENGWLELGLLRLVGGQMGQRDNLSSCSHQGKDEW